MNALDYALQYADRGWPVFPVRNKLPALKGWRDIATCDKEQINKWHQQLKCDFGFEPARANMLVVDVDNKNGKSGSDTLKQIEEKNFDELPETFTVATPTGGFHFYFNGTCGSGPFDVGIDTKSSGGYVVIPGSLHPNGGTYGVIREKEVADAPGWLVPLLRRNRERTEPDTRSLVQLDQQKHVEQALEYLENAAPIAIEGASGDETTLKVSFAVRDLGISQDKCLELLIEHWNERCEPPWSSEDLETKVRNAYSYAKKPAGNETAEARNLMAKAVFEGTPLPIETFVKPEAEDKGPIDVLNYLNTEPEPMKWIIKDWLLASNINVLYSGKGGSGKTLTALDLAMAISTKTAWHDSPVLEQRPVLYVSCEDPTEVIHHRLTAWRRSKLFRTMPEPGMFRIWSRLGFGNHLVKQGKFNSLVEGKFLKLLKAQLDAMPAGPKVMFLDTASDVFGGEENDRSHVAEFVKCYLSSLNTQYDLVTIVLAHPSKNPNAQYSGSTAWEGSFRALWTLSPLNDDRNDERNKKFRVLRNAKNNYGASDDIVLEYTKTFGDSGVYMKSDLAKVESSTDDKIAQVVAEGYAAGDAYGKCKTSTRYIGSEIIEDPLTGSPMSESQIMDAVKRLMSRGFMQVGRQNGKMVLKNDSQPGDEEL